MDWVVQRMFEGGRILPRHISVHNGHRGRVQVAQENDPLRRRQALVARFIPGGQEQAARPTIPPLYDVMLVSATGDTWTLTGHERVPGGVLRDECAVVQSWVMSPAAIDDLQKAEGEWARLSELLHELQEANAQREAKNEAAAGSPAAARGAPVDQPAG